MGFTEYTPGDVVEFPEGPFSGVCGVVREVDAGSAEMRIDVSEGRLRREGTMLRERRHTLTVGFHEVELV